MSAPLTDPSHIEAARVVASMRYDGKTFFEIAAATGLCFETCRAFLFYSDWQPPEWPKVVTRVHADGSWEVVRG